MPVFSRRLLPILTFCSICASYLALSLPRRKPTLPLSYPALATQFLRGRLSLPLEPDSRLLMLPDPYDTDANLPYRVLDASLYHGKFYLYFGAVPALVLFAPYRFATGHDLPEVLAIPLFCMAGYLSSCAAFFLLARQNRWALPFWMQCSIVSLLGSASMVYQLFWTARVYQVAVAAGYCFVMSGFLALTAACRREPFGRSFLVLAGLSFGLAVGCRPHLVIVGFVVLGAYVVTARRSVLSILALAAPMVVCGIGLALYNYARFENPFEFGLKYQLAGYRTSSLPRNIATTLQCAGEFLFTPPNVISEAPFVELPAANPTPGRPGPIVMTCAMIGLLPAAPLSVLGFLFPFLWKKRKAGGEEDRFAWILHAAYWAAVLILILLAIVGLVASRYLVDFAPLILLDTVILMAHWMNSISERGKRALRAVAVTAAVYCPVFNAALSTPRLEITRKFLHM